jgi:hypothetical protein
VKQIDRVGYSGTCCRKGGLVLCFWAHEGAQAQVQLRAGERSSGSNGLNSAASNVVPARFTGSWAILPASEPGQQGCAPASGGHASSASSSLLQRLLRRSSLGSQACGEDLASTAPCTASAAATTGPLERRRLPGMRGRSFSGSALPDVSGQQADLMRVAALEAAQQVRSLSLDASGFKGGPRGAAQQPGGAGLLAGTKRGSFLSLLSLAPGDDVPAAGGRAAPGAAAGTGCQKQEEGWEAVVDNVLLCCLLLHCLSLLPGAVVPGMAGGRWDAARRGGGAAMGCANMLLALLLLLHYTLQGQQQAIRRRGLQATSLLAGGTAVVVMLVSWGAALLAAVQ